MRAALYDRLDAVADRLLTKYQQGAVQSVRLSAAGAAEDRIGPTIEAARDLRAVVSGIDSEHVPDFVQAGDLRLVCRPVSPQPMAGDYCDIDGRRYNIVAVEPIPAAGAPIVLRLYVRGG